VDKKYQFTVNTLVVVRVTAAVMLTKMSIDVIAILVTPHVRKLNAKLVKKVH
jgi:hypothetical protein